MVMVAEEVAGDEQLRKLGVVRHGFVATAFTGRSVASSAAGVTCDVIPSGGSYRLGVCDASGYLRFIAAAKPLSLSSNNRSVWSVSKTSPAILVHRNSKE